jgi:hypothetical protein
MNVSDVSRSMTIPASRWRTLVDLREFTHAPTRASDIGEIPRYDIFSC